MNNIDKNPNYKKIYLIVKEKFDKSSHFNHGPFDETYYTMRVYESAKEVVSKLNKKVRVQQLLVAAILHDIGKVNLKSSKLFTRFSLADKHMEEWHKHAKLGVAIATKILKKMGHSPQFIDEVNFLIEKHDLRENKIKEKSLELQILQDADLIADIGFAGFIRPFLYSGKFSRPIIDTINYVKTEDRTFGGNRLNLKISKLIAKKEMKIQRKLIKEILTEIDSDLL